MCLYYSITPLRSLLHRTLDQIPDLLPKLNSIFKKSEINGKSGGKWRWREQELRTILEDYIYRAPRAHSIRIYVDELGECGDGVAKELAEYFQCLASRATLKYASPIDITPF